MGLYLYMTQVDLEKGPRRVFLCTINMNEMYMMILYDFRCTYEHAIGLS